MGHSKIKARIPLCGRHNTNYTAQKKWTFPLRISSVNVTKSAGNFRFGQIYWRNPEWKTSFFLDCQLFSVLVLAQHTWYHLVRVQGARYRGRGSGGKVRAQGGYFQFEDTNELNISLKGRHDKTLQRSEINHMKTLPWSRNRR